MLVIVCDFPVPGGPCKTKLFPSLAAQMAVNCEESVLVGMGDVEVYDKALNGFKLRYTGSAKTVKLRYYVQGGML